MIDIIWILLSAGFMFINGFLIGPFCALAARISFGIAVSITLFIFFVLISLYGEKAILPNLCKRKNAAISKRLQRFLKSIFNFAGRFYLSSFSTSEISFAVAVTIRMPLSLISSRRASSCRRFVSFPAGVSKRNWSTDIL